MPAVLRRWLSFWLLGLSLVFGASARAQVSEPQLRAGVIVGVLRYANWVALPAANSLTVCSLGEAPGFNVLEQSRSKIAISDKTLTFKALDSVANNDGCAVVVVGAGVDNIKLAALKRLSVLSICDTCDHPDQHAVVLFMSNQRIRFSVDMTLAQSAGVQFGAAMLELAARVEHQ